MTRRKISVPISATVTPATSLSKDSSAEPTTLVEFTLEDVPEGTRLTVVESGFDALPAGWRFEAFRENESGWIEQMQNVRRYVEGA